MERPDYVIPENPVYNAQIPALLDSDPARAETVFNPLFLRIITNVHAVKLFAEQSIADLAITAPTGERYKWGIDNVGVYLEEVL